MAIYDDVLTKATLMVEKTLPSPDGTVLADCCAAAIESLTGRLRETVTPESVEDCFVRAAASLAVAAYVEIDTRQFEGYTQAGVSTAGRSAEATRASADALRRQAELMMIGLVKDRDFCFKAVKG